MSCRRRANEHGTEDLLQAVFTMPSIDVHDLLSEGKKVRHLSS